MDISNLVADLSTFKESLSQFQSHLESQRAATIKGQFREFSQSLGIVADAETINNLFESICISLLKVLANTEDRNDLAVE